MVRRFQLVETAAYLFLFVYASLAYVVRFGRWDALALAAFAATLAALATARLIRDARAIARGESLRTFVGVGVRDARRLSTTRLAQVVAIAPFLMLAVFAASWKPLIAPHKELAFFLARHVFGPSWPMTTIGFASAMIVAIIASRTRGARVILGGDGVRAERGRDARFIAFADIAGVEREDASVDLYLLEGERVRLAFEGERRADLDELADAIEEHIADSRKSAPSTRPHALSRDGRLLLITCMQ